MSKVILLTSDECGPCSEAEQRFKKQIDAGDIEVRSVTNPDDSIALDLATKTKATIPGFVVVDSEDEVIFATPATLESGKAKRKAKETTTEEKAAPEAEGLKPQQPSAQLQKVDPKSCEPEAFFTAAAEYPKLYAHVFSQESQCGACEELRAKILEADIKTPIVDVPGDVCTEIADALEVETYPTVVLLRHGEAKKKHTGQPSRIVQKMIDGK